ncbi:MAG: ATP-binding cassette domain-containing protein [Clostridia bacterium]|nr:ATP-binding cassette domain-containing protein [Clostridia bacterium]
MIKVDHLVKYYGASCAVDDISFEIAKGEIVGLLGPNGAGKSTTMNILTGYLSSTSGTVTVADLDVLDNPLEAKRHIGYLPEQPPLYLDMTVMEYLEFVYALKGCKYHKEKHLEEICDIVKIKDVQKRVIRNLSKGYRQRVGIAQALIGNPEVIIFDEPTVGLDPKQVIEVRNLVRTLGKDHTVILSTHILQEVQAVCDRIIIVNKGKIVADEKTENITRAAQQNRRFLLKICGPQREVLAFLRSRSGIVYAEVQTGRDGDAYCYMIETELGVDVRKNLFYALAEKNWPLIGLEALGMSLEDIFLSIVDHTGAKESRGAKRGGRGRRSAEHSAAAEIMERTRKAQESTDAKSEAVSELFGDDNGNA